MRIDTDCILVLLCIFYFYSPIPLPKFYFISFYIVYPNSVLRKTELWNWHTWKRVFSFISFILFLLLVKYKGASCRVSGNTQINADLVGRTAAGSPACQSWVSTCYIHNKLEPSRGLTRNIDNNPSWIQNISPNVQHGGYIERWSLKEESFF